MRGVLFFYARVVRAHKKQVSNGLVTHINRSKNYNFCDNLLYWNIFCIFFFDDIRKSCYLCTKKKEIADCLFSDIWKKEDNKNSDRN